MKVVTWNINGIRSLKTPLKELLDNFNADIICLQETKISKNCLTEEIVLVDGYNSYFSCSKIKLGYSGVATFVSDQFTPTSAEIGLTGTCNLDIQSKKILSNTDGTDIAMLQQLDSRSPAAIKFNSDICGVFPQSTGKTFINKSIHTDATLFHQLINSETLLTTASPKSVINDQIINQQSAHSSPLVITQVASKSTLLGVQETAISLLELFPVELLKAIDLEGRCVITEHVVISKVSLDLRRIVIVNVYCPRSGENENRQKFKLHFYKVLRKRCEEIIKTGRQVIIVGDINTAHKPIDHCDPNLDETFVNDEGRKWLDTFLIPIPLFNLGNTSCCMLNKFFDESSHNLPNQLQEPLEHTNNIEAIENIMWADSLEVNTLRHNATEVNEVVSEYMQNNTTENIPYKPSCFEDENDGKILCFNNLKSSSLNISNCLESDHMHLASQNSVADEIPIFVDVTRMIHPYREHMYTSWCTLTGARATNYGMRIDCIFVDTYTARNLIVYSDILPEVHGSDHCPVFCTLSCNGVPSDVYPDVCMCNSFNKVGKQDKIFNYFVKERGKDILNRNVKYINMINDFKFTLNCDNKLYRHDIEGENTFRDAITTDLSTDSSSNHGLTYSKDIIHSKGKEKLSLNKLKDFKSFDKNKNFSKMSTTSKKNNLQQTKLNFCSNKNILDCNNSFKIVNTHIISDEFYNGANLDGFKSGVTKYAEISNTFQGKRMRDNTLKRSLKKEENYFNLSSSQNHLSNQLKYKNKFNKYFVCDDDSNLPSSQNISYNESIFQNNNLLASTTFQPENTFVQNNNWNWNVEDTKLCANETLFKNSEFYEYRKINLNAPNSIQSYNLANSNHDATFNNVIEDLNEGSVMPLTNFDDHSNQHINNFAGVSCQNIGKTLTSVNVLNSSIHLESQVSTNIKYSRLYPIDTLKNSANNNRLDKDKSNFWEKIKYRPIRPVLCSGHKEPCVLRMVKKVGPNLGKKFWVCSRPEGHKTNKDARCDFFEWCKK